MVNDNFCRKCQYIFTGHWRTRELSALEVGDSTSIELEDSPDAEVGDDYPTSDFYDRPNWIQAPFSLSSGLACSPQHHSITQLKESAADGCKLCILIWDQVWDLLRDREQEDNIDLSRAIGIATVRPTFIDTVQDPAGELPQTLDLEVTYCIDGRDDLEEAYINLVVGLYLGRANEWLHGTPKLPSATANSSPDTVKAIQLWVSECRKKHRECRATSEVALRDPLRTVMPTRVLDVMSDCDPRFIRLIETTQLSPRDRARDYISLSHRWGDYLPVQLLSENYDSIIESLCIQSLPKTFQDAIVFTRALGVRYLWIDALCIIQDSRSDWLHESSLMASVYSCAYLNIAATDATDGRSGLFQQRDQELLSPCLIQASWTGHAAGDYVCWDETVWRRHVEQSTLSTRAWVFQERLLAPRTVHCARNQTWWECRMLIANECFPKAVPYQGEDWHYDMIESFAEMSRIARTDIIEGSRHWMGLVEKYTRTKITKDSDRLLALSGVAFAVSQKLTWPKEDYVAGLWKSDFAPNLLWSVDGKGSREQDSYVAPSWSWASVNGPVRHWQSDALDVIRSGLCAEFQEVIVKTEGDALGIAKSGHIILNAHIYQASFLDPHRGGYSHFGRLQFGRDHVQLLQEEGRFDESMDDEDYYDPGRVDQLDVVWCMISRSKSPFVRDEYVCFGLVLIQAEQHPAGTYRRIGESRLFFTDDMTDIIQQLSLHEHGLESIGPCTSDGRSRIKII